MFSNADESRQGRNMSATALRWFACDTAHFVLIHIKICDEAIAPLPIFIPI